MSDPRGGRDGRRSGEEPDQEGWESLAEDSENVLRPSDELEQALREATEAVEAREHGRRGAGPPAGGAPGRTAGGRGDAPGPADPEQDLLGAGSAGDELEALRAELAETRDRWLRLNADFDNFRKRTLKEREEAFAYGHEKLAKDLLPAVDNLQRAVDAARKSGVGDLESLLQGIELVQRDLASALARHGVEEVEALGQPFDPSVHEALAQIPDASVPPNTVVQVFQPGYRLRDRLLRPAQVVVSKAGD